MLVHCTSHYNNKQFRRHLAPLRHCRQATNKYDHPSFSYEEFRTHLIPVDVKIHPLDKVTWDFYIFFCIL